jgi:hypothetical protein
MTLVHARFRAISVETAVTDNDFHKLLAAVEALSAAQLTALDAAVRGRLGAATDLPAAETEDVGEPRADCASVADIEAHFAAKPLRFCLGPMLHTKSLWRSENTANHRYM